MERTHTRCQIMWQLFLFSYQETRNCSVLLSLLSSHCVLVQLCTPKRISLFLVKILLLFSFLPTASTYKIQKQQIYFLLYFTILYYYCEVTLFREIGASAYRINREWSLTAPYYFSHLDCKYDSLFFFYNKK
jgi:hypothetical protein